MATTVRHSWGSYTPTVRRHLCRLRCSRRSPQEESRVQHSCARGMFANSWCEFWCGYYVHGIWMGFEYWNRKSTSPSCKLISLFFELPLIRFEPSTFWKFAVSSLKFYTLKHNFQILLKTLCWRKLNMFPPFESNIDSFHMGINKPFNQSTFTFKW